MVGGISFSSIVFVHRIASTAPAAPNKCPIFPLVELTITFLAASPKADLIAIVSQESFK